MKTIFVKAKQHSYPVYIGDGIFSKLTAFLESKKLYKNLFIVIDRNVDKHFGKYIRRNFKKYSANQFYYIFNASEKSKSYAELRKIHSALLTARFGRDTLLIAIGGGIAGDLAGLAASIYMRGIQIIHIPTTLVACVDSSIGGKTAVNFNRYKNLIGSFYHPEFVLCDIKFLSTLSKIEFGSGVGEIIKYTFITNEKFFDFVKENLYAILNGEKKIIEQVINECVQFKASVVSQDENEIGLRKILNFGHTFAHALERELKYRVKHGEAVIAGIVCAIHLSYQKHFISKELFEKLLTLPAKLKLSKFIKKVNPQPVYENMLVDKKNRNSKINFVLIQDFGKMILDVYADKKEILLALERGIHSLNYK